ETDDTWSFGGVKVAGDRVADHGLELVEGIRVGKNGETEGTGLVAAFGCLLHGEYDFALRHVPYPALIIPRSASSFFRTDVWGARQRQGDTIFGETCQGSQSHSANSSPLHVVWEVSRWLF